MALDIKGISAKSRSNNSEERSIELLSPNVHTNASTSCMVVSYSLANFTALSESRKHNTKARQKVMTMRGFCASGGSYTGSRRRSASASYPLQPPFRGVCKGQRHEQAELYEQHRHPYFTEHPPWGRVEPLVKCSKIVYRLCNHMVYSFDILKASQKKRKRWRWLGRKGLWK